MIKTWESGAFERKNRLRGTHVALQKKKEERRKKACLLLKRGGELVGGVNRNTQGG